MNEMLNVGSESGVRAFAYALESTNVHAIDLACASLPATTVWEV